MLNTDECKMQNEVAAKTCFLTKIAYSEIQNFKFRQVRWCIAKNGPQIKQRRQLIIIKGLFEATTILHYEIRASV